VKANSLVNTLGYATDFFPELTKGKARNIVFSMGWSRLFLYFSMILSLPAGAYATLPFAIYSSETSDVSSVEESTEIYSAKRKAVKAPLRKLIDLVFGIPSSDSPPPTFSILSSKPHRLSYSHNGLGFPLLT